MTGSVRAVIFDYFGTLTLQVPAAVRREGTARVAQALGIDRDLLFDRLSACYTERATGSRGDMVSTLAWVATECGHEPTPQQLSAACAERLLVESVFIKLLREDAVATLGSLKEAGFRLGVVSDCTHELPECWPELPVAPFVDATVFSVVIGRRKPHPSLYLAACNRLGVSPSEVVYVGDGGSNELTGARALGMTAIRLVAPDALDGLVYDPEPDWRGPVIRRLGEVAGMLGEAARREELALSPDGFVIS
jgi:putative hydrolase of the HAD superfamily